VRRNLQKKTRDQATEDAESFSLKIDGLAGAFRSERVRWLISKENDIKRDSGMPDEAFRKLFEEAVKQEAERSIILSELRRRNEASIGEIMSSTKMPSKQILRHMIALMKRGSVAFAGEKGDEYSFTAIEPPE
jgi:DNA-binding transcriptional ArsR family regulator